MHRAVRAFRAMHRRNTVSARAWWQLMLFLALCMQALIYAWASETENTVLASILNSLKWRRRLNLQLSSDDVSTILTLSLRFFPFHGVLLYTIAQQTHTQFVSSYIFILLFFRTSFLHQIFLPSWLVLCCFWKVTRQTKDMCPLVCCRFLMEAVSNQSCI